MNDNKINYPIGELPQSASQSSQAVNETAEKKRNQKKSLIKLGAMGVLTAVTIIIGSLSWFTQNRETSVSNMQIKTATLPFDIATKGARVRNQAVINSERSEYVGGTSGSYQDTSSVSGTYYTGDSLLLRFDPSQQDDLNTSNVNESYLPDIAPGSSGELSLYVIPKNDSAMTVRVSLHVVAFATIEDMTNNEENKIIEIKDAADFASKATELGNNIAADDAADYVAAANYLKGHILFFGGKGDTTNATESLRYYFTTPYTTRTFDKSIGAGNEGKAVQVPIYWMWTNTLGQILLPDNTSGQRSGYPILADANTDGKTAIKTYLINNRSDVFTNNGESTISNINSVAQTVTAAEFNSDAFKSLSSGYNEADYMIGTKIAYFMIEVTVEPEA